MILLILGALGAFIWISILFLPWRPWDVRERLDARDERPAPSQDLSVLIPARNEEQEIGLSLQSLKRQNENLRVILVDDQSEDRTREIALSVGLPHLEILDGSPLPTGWSGKLWALEQGLQKVQSSYVLVMDADIELKPGLLSELFRKMDREKLDFVSLMASLRMENFWEKLLIPAYIYFFKLLYPFSLSNSRSRSFSAGAGGCILAKTEVLRSVGAYSSLRGALIDDCELAKKVKQAGFRSWIGLTRSVLSHRSYSKLSEIWDLVARSAFTYLNYSPLLLVLCSLLLFSCSGALPIAFIFIDKSDAFQIFLLAGLYAMFRIYLPILRFYGLSPLWTLLKPVAGSLYLLMTWSSAFRHWLGQGAAWKGRHYGSAHKEAA